MIYAGEQDNRCVDPKAGYKHTIPDQIAHMVQKCIKIIIKKKKKRISIVSRIAQSLTSKVIDRASVRIITYK